MKAMSPKSRFLASLGMTGSEFTKALVENGVGSRLAIGLLLVYTCKVLKRGRGGTGRRTSLRGWR